MTEFVDNAMVYRELAKKFDDFYEKLLVKPSDYAIIICDRRKPSKMCPNGKAKDRAIQLMVFPDGRSVISHGKERMPR